MYAPAKIKHDQYRPSLLLKPPKRPDHPTPPQTPVHHRAKREAATQLPVDRGEQPAPPPAHTHTQRAVLPTLGSQARGRKPRCPASRLDCRPPITACSRSTRAGRPSNAQRPAAPTTALLSHPRITVTVDQTLKTRASKPILPRSLIHAPPTSRLQHTSDYHSIRPLACALSPITQPNPTKAIVKSSQSRRSCVCLVGMVGTECPVALSHTTAGGPTSPLPSSGLQSALFP